jgi:hypothetical protein
MLLTIAFLCFIIQVVAWVVLPSSVREVSTEIELEPVPSEAAA